MALNAKQELFAQSLAQGMSASAAYKAAGYPATKDGAIRANASRLLTNTNVKSRIAELQRQAAAKTLVTVESITAELDASLAIAKQQQNPAAMTAASMAKAKLSWPHRRSRRGRADGAPKADPRSGGAGKDDS